MQLPVTRRLRPRGAPPIGALALLGFGAGVAAGFFLGEWFGRSSRSRLTGLLDRFGRHRPAPASLRTVAAEVDSALGGANALGLESFTTRLAGGQGLALHGWAPDRPARTRAWRLAQAVAGAVPVLNRLLVRGEDDRPDKTDLPGQPRTA